MRESLEFLVANEKINWKQNIIDRYMLITLRTKFKILSFTHDEH